MKEGEVKQEKQNAVTAPESVFFVTTCVHSQVLPESFWPDLRCIIVVLEESEKDVGSSDGMRRSVQTSELLQYRSTAVVPERIRRLIHAYESRNFSEFGRVVMAESNQLHAVCMDSFPPLKYMSDASWQVIRVVDEFNAEDRIRAAYTFDAGPNACIFLEEKNVPVFLEQLCRQFVVAPEIVTSLSSSGDVRLSTLVAPPKSTFSVRNIIVSRVGGSPRVVG
ncbi:unnamed protein product [Heligmosomoides polygyrus]|uniref:MDD_C domain-containing protein n=1 Tax=Heligmosomoides polygyrus TaxID=6339 RepID=A0A183F280_HELPZ|nr:unnamed protein product [Heligmosomoides polygyrus]